MRGPEWTKRMARSSLKVRIGVRYPTSVLICSAPEVLGVRHLAVPIPRLPTLFTCTLNNGIHFVTTPECQLDRDSAIDQEFEL